MKLQEIKDYNVFANLKHFWRKGILSDYWFGYLEAHQENGIQNRITSTKKDKILRDMLLNSLKRKLTFDAYTELNIFYNQNSRGDFHEIKRYKKMFHELIKLEILFEYNMKELIEFEYSRVRDRLEKKGNWSLYHIIIDKEFQTTMDYLEKQI